MHGISSSVFATRKFNKTILTKSHMVNIVGKCRDSGDDDPIYCKNKLVVLTTEWSPWLQTNWRDSGYERFAFGVEDYICIRQP